MSAQELVKNVVNLVSLPEVCIRINQMVDDPDATIADISAVISQDPALTARLLKVANSPLFGLSKKIETVSRAMMILGTQQVRDLALATSAMSTFDDIANEFITMEEFWRHSLACGLVARRLVGHAKPMHTESVFVAGLLHDIGRLIIFNRIPFQAKQVLNLMGNTPAFHDSYEAEKKILGFDHAEVGGELIKQWQLPQILYESIAYHHQPTAAPLFIFDASIIHIANTLAILATSSAKIGLAETPLIQNEAWKITCLSPEIIAPTIEAVQAELEDVFKMFSDVK